MGVLHIGRGDQLQQVRLVVDVELRIRAVRQPEGPLAVGGRDHAQAVRLMGPEILVVNEIEQLLLDVLVGRNAAVRAVAEPRSWPL